MQAKIRIFNKKRLLIGRGGGATHYKDFLGGVGGAHEGGGPMFRLMPLPLLSLCMVANIWRGMSSGGLKLDEKNYVNHLSTFWQKFREINSPWNSVRS